MLPDLLLVLVGFFLLVFPFVLYRREEGFLEGLCFSLAVSFSLLVVYLYFLSFFGGVGFFSCFFFVAAVFCFSLKKKGFRLKKPVGLEKIFLAVFFLFSAVVVFPYVDKYVYPQDDAKLITLLTRIVVENNGGHFSLEPYKPIDSFNYLPGGFLFASFFCFLLGLRPESVVLYLTPLMTLAFSLSCFYAGEKLFGSPHGFFVGVLSMFGAFPYFITYGWNTYLFGLFLLPFLMGLLAEPVSDENVFFVCLVSAAVFLVHEILFLFVLVVLGSRFVADFSFGELGGEALRRYAAVGVLCVFLVFSAVGSQRFVAERMVEIYTGFFLESAFGVYSDMLGVYFSMLRLHGFMAVFWFPLGLVFFLKKRKKNHVFVLLVFFFSLLSCFCLLDFRLKQVVERLAMFSFLPLTIMAGSVLAHIYGLRRLAEEAGERLTLAVGSAGRRVLDLRPKTVFGIIMVLIFFFLFLSPMYLILSWRRYHDVEEMTHFSSKDYEAMMWIEHSVPKDAVFLNDGGGVEGWGGGCDSGEWVMPITGRRVLLSGNFISEDFWHYDMPARFGVLKAVSQDPDSSEALGALDSFNVTHVFLGDERYALHRNCLLSFDDFVSSENYRLVYGSSDSAAVFEVLR